jgi:hypothetical protein
MSIFLRRSEGESGSGCGNCGTLLHEHGAALECPRAPSQPLSRVVAGPAAPASGDLLRDLHAVATGRVGHAYAGMCPDQIVHDVRTGGCPACDVLRRVDAALAGAPSMLGPCPGASCGDDCEHDPALDEVPAQTWPRAVRVQRGDDGLLNTDGHRERCWTDGAWWMCEPGCPIGYAPADEPPASASLVATVAALRAMSSEQRAALLVIGAEAPALLEAAGRAVAFDGRSAHIDALAAVLARIDVPKVHP